MCAIVGALLWGMSNPSKRWQAETELNYIIKRSHERGRDGRGIVVVGDRHRDFPVHSTEKANGSNWKNTVILGEYFVHSEAAVIGNLRAEPTTEYVKVKFQYDQQPYTLEDWNVVHNGTIANDKALRSHKLHTKIDSATVAEQLVELEDCSTTHFQAFYKTVKNLTGSYAILATHTTQSHTVYAACNYRPIWYVETDFGVFFASSRDYFSSQNYSPKMLEPYTIAKFTYNGFRLEIVKENLLDPGSRKPRALVVCSGGLDSTVAAVYAQKVMKADVTLVHFRYGSRAEGPEVSAIWKIAEALGVGLWIRHLDVYEPTDSPLLQKDSTIAGGEEGAEFAHEWVPARNLVMLAHATAMAEAKGFDTIVLGNNLEEAGAYPDNEPEFIARFNDLLPFAVGDGKRVRVAMPVGNLMKHEIVALGLQLGAPIDKTWSCYRAGKLHCGTCGPCFMRRTAFEINGVPEVITYENSK